jgi:hypothetical protein
MTCLWHCPDCYAPIKLHVAVSTQTTSAGVQVITRPDLVTLAVTVHQRSHKR